MQGKYLIWKDVGETPLQAIARLRAREHIAPDVPMTYAGRLDPLAEGQLLILTGEECKNKDAYLDLDKEYEVEIFFGVSTDTADPMGIIQKVNECPRSLLGQEVLDTFIGKVQWPYPAFSSKPVQGKPLFLWSLEGRIAEIDIPTRTSEIYELELLGGRTTKSKELQQEVMQKVTSITPVSKDVESKRLGADFRREAVLKSWEHLWSRTPLDQPWQIATVRCRCSAGTYMRTLAEQVGESLGTPALALAITRTKILVE